jgi:hypothetical protein
MYVYIWKDQDGTPFYVGLTKRVGRTNPRNSGGRNWLTQQKIVAIGCDNIVVELRHVVSIEDGMQLEKTLISSIGRIQLGTGPLTNLRDGGDGVHSPTEEHREKLRQIMLNPMHPCRSPEAKEKKRKRMADPDVLAKFTGDNNPAKKPETRAKLKAKWADSEYRAAQTAARTGKPKNFSDEDRARRSVDLKANSHMKSWSERNGKDLEFEAKRLAGLQASLPRRLEKMSEPIALAQRKARLKETMNSEAYKAKRAQWDTPEYRAKLSASKREYWAKRKASM